MFFPFHQILFEKQSLLLRIPHNISKHNTLHFRRRNRFDTLFFQHYLIMSTTNASSCADDTLREPLLVTAVPMKRHQSSAATVDGSSNQGNDDMKSLTKRNEQLQVHRLLSFMLGSTVGILLQFASVLVFAKLIIHAQHQHGDDITALLRGAVIEGATTSLSVINGDEEVEELFKQTVMDRYQAILQSEDSTWFNVAMWLVYHASLGVYLIVWIAMMTLAVSKVGWKCISTGLYIPTQVTRRTCFLRTFFFINGTCPQSIL